MAPGTENGGGAKRIAIILHDFAPGGTERIIIRLANHWASAGREVTILCGNEQGPSRCLVGEAVAVRAARPAVSRALGSRRRFAQRLVAPIAATGFDVLVGPGNFHLPILAGLVEQGVTTPIVAKLSNPLDRVDLGPFRHALFGRAKRSQTGGLAKLVAMSDALAAEALRTLPGAPIAVVFEPIIEGAPAMARTSPRTGPPRLLVAGRLVAQKRVELALEAFAAWKEPGAHLTIVGDGAERSALEKLVRKLRIASRVEFTGRQPSLEHALAHSELLLSTSAYEGFPATMVEAIVAGVPVVATPSSVALPEILLHPSLGAVAAAEPAALADALGKSWRGPAIDEDARLALSVRHDAAASAARWLEVLDAAAAERR